MHELSLASNIYATCRATLRSRGGGRLDSVRVAVGELTAVEPELLRFAWQAVVAGSGDQAAALTIDWRPARQTCDGCGDVPRADGAWAPRCPTCGAPLRIEGGDELEVVELSFTPAAGIEEAIR